MIAVPLENGVFVINPQFDLFDLELLLIDN